MKIQASAAQEIRKRIPPGEGWMHVEIRAGGCNGFEKVFGTCKELEPLDHVFDDVVVVPDTSLVFLADATLRYEESLIGSRFVLDIPQASSNCGCGSSFDF